VLLEKLADEAYLDKLLQCVAVCCSVLQCVAVCCSVLQCVSVLPVKLVDEAHLDKMLQCVAVCCSVLQCVAVCCSVVQCVAVCCSVLQCVSVLPVKLVDEAHLDKMLHALFELWVALVTEIRSHLIHHWNTFSKIRMLRVLLCKMTIELSFQNLCAFRAWRCPCCRNSESFDTPLVHILKRQLTTNTTI